ncbi:MAG TPA: NAD-dependent epimerase/dehydratase family protein [Candidatus Limnocylindrales bacterium]|nr:NAD-dependent epimerase/dehydratase family protein [Candidatus Limnocylindrales bacterium]
MKIMVAGGAGFVGSHLSRELLAGGHGVVCVDDLSTGSLGNIADLFGQPGYEFINADVADAPLRQVDVIAHLASPASPIDYDRMPTHTLRANSLGTFRLIDVAASVGARFSYVSTSEVYGDPLVHPQPEEYWGNVDPVGPRSCYDEAKRFSEALVVAARREAGIRANIIRPFNTYGPAMRRNDGRVIPEMIAAALDGRPLIIHGDGLQTRSFCYVTDLVDGLRHVILDEAADGLIVNIGNPREVTMLELAKRIIHGSGGGGEMRFIEARPGDPARRRPVINRMRARYGWNPRVQLSDGLRRTIAAFRAADMSPEQLPRLVDGLAADVVGAA